MAWPIIYKSNLIQVCRAVSLGTHLIKFSAQGVNNLKIRQTVISTDQISLTWSPRSNHPDECVYMVVNMDPIAHLLSIAINRDRVSIQRIEDA